MNFVSSPILSCSKHVELEKGLLENFVGFKEKIRRKDDEEKYLKSLMEQAENFVKYYEEGKGRERREIKSNLNINF